MLFPGNLKFFYGIYIPISSLDFLPSDDINVEVFDFSIDEDEAENALLEEMGYETHNFIMNVGSCFYYMIGYLGLLLFVLIQFFYFKLPLGSKKIGS